ncbi:hypothetical protein WOLCODRAFT_151896 [Wolfiporia cocos MD-104 SS10]|uniref:Uncharacterized protein n=1 Tax=Wolfiporia cocos (strain MD-104) TaxID=742152 RepID=A0A2H3JSR1_WOLCO|nr:hypothetical protein WOLCODRAFT_151896 [Wolfiporia cocos MD-104 SS10]
MARLQGENAAPLARLKELETSGAYRGSGSGVDPLVLRAGVQQQGECIPSIITCTFLESYKSVRRKQHAMTVD